jgi:hypothetical protein
MSQSIVIDREKAAAIEEQSGAFLLERIYAQAARFQRNIRGAQQFASWCPDGEHKPSHQAEVYNPATGQYQQRGQ